jgi:hypothetical protein
MLKQTKLSVIDITHSMIIRPHVLYFSWETLTRLNVQYRCVDYLTYKYVISYQNILCYFTSRKLWLKLKLKLLKSGDNNINLINRVCICVYIFSVSNIFVVLITLLKYVCIQIGMLIHYMSVSFDNP